MCEIDSFSRGGPQGDVLGYALRNPDVTDEMNRSVSLRLTGKHAQSDGTGNRSPFTDPI